MDLVANFEAPFNNNLEELLILDQPADADELDFFMGGGSRWSRFNCLDEATDFSSQEEGVHGGW